MWDNLTQDLAKLSELTSSPEPMHLYPFFINSQWTKHTTASCGQVMLPATQVYNTSKPAMFSFNLPTSVQFQAKEMKTKVCVAASLSQAAVRCQATGTISTSRLFSLKAPESWPNGTYLQISSDIMWRNDLFSLSFISISFSIFSFN